MHHLAMWHQAYPVTSCCGTGHEIPAGHSLTGRPLCVVSSRDFMAHTATQARARHSTGE